MLNNFIYAKLKSLFEEKLAANEVPQEAIVFIEDTKEIWNHGTYFPSGKSVEEIENIVASSETVQMVMEQIVKDTLPISLITDGDGTKYLSNNGEYKIPGEIISTLHSDLISLKNNSQLVPGQKYRITDYVTTVSQNRITSLEHPFDIVVTALNQQAISTEASAMQNESDTYFSTSDLSKWKLWYIPQVSTITNITVDISSLESQQSTITLQNTNDPFIYNDIEYFAYKGSFQGIVPDS